MTLCIVQARLNSQRFPRKVLADLHGRPLIVHVVERALQIAGVDRVVVATGARWDVLELSRVLRHLKVDVLHFTGVAENDVLGRFAATLALYPAATTLMRVTGDCPMLNPAVSAAVLRLYQDTPGCEYAWNAATSVHEATRAAGGDCFDLLISDIGLPDGTGMDVVRSVRQCHPNIPAIAMTGFGMEQDIRNSEEAGFTIHLTKPVDVNSLETAIRVLTSQRGFSKDE